jgi:hypothetical protein
MPGIALQKLDIDQQVISKTDRVYSPRISRDEAGANLSAELGVRLGSLYSTSFVSCIDKANAHRCTSYQKLIEMSAMETEKQFNAQLRKRLCCKVAAEQFTILGLLELEL